VDYFTENKMVARNHYHLANDEDFTDKSYCDNLFQHRIVIHNVRRYIDSGMNGRMIHELAALLESEVKVYEVIDRVLVAGLKRR
jgi:hypothetical protein